MRVGRTRNAGTFHERGPGNPEWSPTAPDADERKPHRGRHPFGVRHRD